MDVILNKKDTAALLGISYRQVDRMIRDGRITHCAKVGECWRINVTKEYPELKIGESSVAN